MNTHSTQKIGPKRRIVPTRVLDRQPYASSLSHNRLSDDYEFSEEGKTLFASLSVPHQLMVSSHLRSLAYHKHTHKRNMLTGPSEFLRKCVINEGELMIALHINNVSMP